MFWDATAAQTGAAVTVTSASWNGSVAPGGTASFGFLGSWTGANSAPAAFTLNGTRCGRPVPVAPGDNAGVNPVLTRHRRAVVAGAVVAYALLAAACRPLTTPALIAVLLAGVPLCWVGVRRRPRHARPVGARSALVWLGLAGLAAAFEVGLVLGPDDATHPTLSTLADPVLHTYPGRVLGYVLWVGSGAWLVSR